MSELKERLDNLRALMQEPDVVCHAKRKKWETTG